MVFSFSDYRNAAGLFNIGLTNLRNFFASVLCEEVAQGGFFCPRRKQNRYKNARNAVFWMAVREGAFRRPAGFLASWQGVCSCRKVSLEKHIGGRSKNFAASLHAERQRQAGGASAAGRRAMTRMIGERLAPRSWWPRKQAALGATGVWAAFIGIGVWGHLTHWDFKRLVTLPTSHRPSAEPAASNFAIGPGGGPTPLGPRQVGLAS